MISNLKLDIFPDKKKEEILNATFTLLEKTGASIHCEEAVKLLVDNGCTADGVNVKIPRELVKRCINTVPKAIQMYDRNGELSMLLGGRNTYFGSGPTCCYFFDPYTGERRKAKKCDAANTAKLTDALPHLDFAMSLCMIEDETPTLADVHETDAMLRNTTKPICTWAFSAENLEYILKMCVAVAGGEDKLAEKPFVIIFNEPITPLTHPKESMEKVMMTTRYGVPNIYCPGMILGGTAPVTVAGALTVGLADTFVGLVVSQLIRPGAPFIAASSCTPLEMSTMQTPYGAPETSLELAASNEILRYLGIPNFDLAGATDSKLVDAQAGIEAAFQTIFSLLSGGNLVHDCGFMDTGMTGSLSMLCVCNEVISMAKRLCTGFEVNEDMIGLEYIEEAGPGGNFLQSMHTVEHFRSELHFPKLLERRPYNAWQEDGALSMEQRATKMVQDILSEHRPEALSDDITAKLDEFVAQAEAMVKSMS